MGYGQNQPMGYGQPNYGQPQGFNQGYNQSMNSQMRENTSPKKNLGLGLTIVCLVIGIICAFFDLVPANITGIAGILSGYRAYKDTHNKNILVAAIVAEAIILFISLANL
jgi:hypothetical protein